MTEALSDSQEVTFLSAYNNLQTTSRTNSYMCWKFKKLYVAAFLSSSQLAADSICFLLFILNSSTGSSTPLYCSHGHVNVLLHCFLLRNNAEFLPLLQRNSRTHFQLLNTLWLYSHLLQAVWKYPPFYLVPNINISIVGPSFTSVVAH